MKILNLRLLLNNLNAVLTLLSVGWHLLSALNQASLPMVAGVFAVADQCDFQLPVA